MLHLEGAQYVERNPPRQSALRRGRRSLIGQPYLVTTTTVHRRSVFTEFRLAREVIRTLRESDIHGFSKTLAFVVMPDHLHWLFELGQPRSLSETVAAVKCISARKIGHPVWAPGFHDHAIRAQEPLQRAARYIVDNPVRAGLVGTVGDYPHWDAAWL